MPVKFGPQIAMNESSSVQLARHQIVNGGMNWQLGRDGNRCRARYGNCRHYYQGYYYQTPWWTLPLIIGNTIANGNHGRSLVQRCLSRYRSNNTRTDMWLGNSGNHYRCNSPY
jgi:BA14K-like protein